LYVALAFRAVLVFLSSADWSKVCTHILGRIGGYTPPNAKLCSKAVSSKGNMIAGFAVLRGA
jgi:hypothetical protein